MEHSRDSVNPGIFATKISVMVGLVLVDCMCNGFVDHLWGKEYEVQIIVLFVLQALNHFMMLLFFFMLLWHTFLLRFGLLGEACSHFRSIFLMSLFRLLVMAGARVPRLLSQVDNWPITKYWDAHLHYGFFLAHNVVSVGYYIVFLRASFEVGRSRFYKAQLWDAYRKKTKKYRSGPRRSGL